MITHRCPKVTAAKLPHWTIYLIVFLSAYCISTWYSVDAQTPKPPLVRSDIDVYVPLDSWVYTALDRLRGLGYLDTAFLGMRPWTERSIARMLEEADSEDGMHDDPQAEETYRSLLARFPRGTAEVTLAWDHRVITADEAYVRLQEVLGLPLRDSFHLGQTISNDFGRPYQSGLNWVIGSSESAQVGRLSIYVRSEYQRAPSATGYSPALFSLLSGIDMVPVSSNPLQATIPTTPIAADNDFRIIEANLSYHLLDHQISVGKSDHWFSPAKGGSFLYSNNAENIYAFQVDRTEPLYIPVLSRLTGPFGYDFLVGSLKGHSDPNAPWLHTEKISFKPSVNVEIGFARSTIWGGEGHVPITIHSFLRSFFSFQNVSVAQKNSRSDPGARFGSFDFSWRLPFLTHWATLYTDSLVHDDVSPIDAPRHAGVRPGFLLSEMPGIPRLDLRIEGVNTDPPTRRSNGGGYLYAENVQVQGYTNKGYLIGDAFGRESKGGQAWATYHLSPHEILQVSFRELKVAKDFIPEGTSQQSFELKFVKLIGKELEISGVFQQELWKAPSIKLLPNATHPSPSNGSGSPPFSRSGGRLPRGDDYKPSHSDTLHVNTGFVSVRCVHPSQSGAFWRA